MTISNIAFMRDKELTEDEIKNFEGRRRTSGTHSEVIFKSEKRLRKKPMKYSSKVEYDFLQYIRIVMRWAYSNIELPQRYIELLLYLYPIGVFTMFQFRSMCRTISMYEKKQLDMLVDKGFIRIWRPRKGIMQAELYTLTDKSRLLCARMHKMCVAEEKIPISSHNAMTKSEFRIDKYFLEKAKKMNKKFEEKKKKAADTE
jgi:hypothetical protein